MCFTVGKYQELKQSGMDFQSSGREMGKLWKAMNVEARAKYEAEAAEHKKVYDAAVIEWERQNPELAADRAAHRTPRKPSDKAAKPASPAASDSDSEPAAMQS
jgi:hypothetical protein